MKSTFICIILCLSVSMLYAQSEPSDLTEQLRKSIEQLDLDIDEIKKKVEETISQEEIDRLKKTVEEEIERQADKIKEEDVVKQYEDVKEQIESGEIEEKLKEFFPEMQDPAMIEKMEQAMEQLKNFDTESLFKDGTIILGQDSIDISTYLDPENELMKRFQKDIQSLDENFRTVYPNIDVMLKSLEDGFEDVQELDIERILEKIQKSFSQPANNKSITI